MQTLEAVAIVLPKENLDKCPYKEADPKDIEEYRNKALELGKNLKNETHGDGNNNTGGEPPKYLDKPVDTDNPEKPGESETLTVAGDEGWPYILAPHHLIPGNGSLRKSDLYNHYMSKEGKDTKVLVNIGYDVNGSHNGVWLPGNYAIRAKRLSALSGLPFGSQTWSKRDPEWSYDYMLACVRKTKRQFHDAHTAYSEAVEKFLNKIDMAIEKHCENCSDCRKQKEKLVPPYVIKKRLHGLSAFLRGQLGWPIQKRGFAWITSDRFKNRLKDDVRKHVYDGE